MSSFFLSLIRAYSIAQALISNIICLYFRRYYQLFFMQIVFHIHIALYGIVFPLVLGYLRIINSLIFKEATRIIHINQRLQLDWAYEPQ
jgi:hypothetical protein